MPARWMKTVATIPCRVVKEDSEAAYEWRRIQTSEQQAQRERKNLMQKALIFTRRARYLMLEDRVLPTYPVPKCLTLSLVFCSRNSLISQLFQLSNFNVFFMRETFLI